MLEKMITINLHCGNFPGLVCGDRQPVYVGVQKNHEIIDETPGDATKALFAIPARLKAAKNGQPDFLGPYIHGKAGDRFIYLVWFEKCDAQAMFGRAKIKLNHLTWGDLQADSLAAHVNLTDKKGAPVCATVPPELIHWQLETAQA